LPGSAFQSSAPPVCSEILAFSSSGYGSMVVCADFLYKSGLPHCKI
jgi:hypothetical protein